MKVVLSIFAALLTASVAQAEVKLPGTVVEIQCGSAREDHPLIGGYSIVEVCNAGIVGERGDYLIVKESRVLPGGAQRQTTVWSMTPDSGSYSVTQIGYVDSDHKFVRYMPIRAVTGTVKIEYKTNRSIKMISGQLAGRAFKAKDFRSIFHTM